MNKFNLENRRYIGNKNKLLDWIFEEIQSNTEGETFLDLFAGTGVVARRASNYYKEVHINDFLSSNNVIYNGFLSQEPYNQNLIYELAIEFSKLQPKQLKDNYFNLNFANSYFGNNDAKKIGEIRERIEQLFIEHKINKKEKSILLSSLIYSADRIANTVGHYESYHKKDLKDNQFNFLLINPIKDFPAKIKITQEDANELAKEVAVDIVFLDPPYNSRQYSRFYHVLDNLVEWKKPELFGTAKKPKPEKMSDYSRAKAPQVFDNLVKSLNCKYIVVTYNNTYNPKSKTSKNKISFEQILNSLNSIGETKYLEKEHSFFNSGKTDFSNHREFLFITKVNNNEN
ncbi:DNA adenine methylase [Mycoplasma hafezii]|uniref:DNA adenine methylase n=1 Tax=Mycoplasma hafezii TaxID=525886 RepID=UPI003CF580E8